MSPCLHDRFGFAPLASKKSSMRRLRCFTARLSGLPRWPATNSMSSMSSDIFARASTSSRETSSKTACCFGESLSSGFRLFACCGKRDTEGSASDLSSLLACLATEVLGRILLRNLKCAFDFSRDASSGLLLPETSLEPVESSVPRLRSESRILPPLAFAGLASSWLLPADVDLSSEKARLASSVCLRSLRNWLSTSAVRFFHCVFGVMRMIARIFFGPVE